MFDAVIFDWDGTLADSWEAILASFHSALREVLGIDVEDEFIKRRIGVGAAWTFREILRARGLPADDQVIRSLVSVKVRVAIQEAGKVKLFPGALELLESLNGKVKMGLASMNNRAVIDTLLDSLGVSQFFTAVVTVDEVTVSKPDPQIFLKTAQKLATIPEKCVVLEDSIFGVKAAKAGNLACIAVIQGAYSREELADAKPDIIVNSLREKDGILRYISH